MVARGLALVPEGRRVFPYMTVRENLEMGAYSVKSPEQVQQSLERVFAPVPQAEGAAEAAGRHLQRRGAADAGHRPGADVRAALPDAGRALPGAAAHASWPTCSRSLKILHGQGVTILLVEQNVRKSLEIAQRGYVLEHGRVALAGDSKSLLADEGVRRAYLGI